MMFNESYLFQLTAIDEVHVEQNKSGHIVKQLCRIRVFFLSFLTGQFFPITILLFVLKFNLSLNLVSLLTNPSLILLSGFFVSKDNYEPCKLEQRDEKKIILVFFMRLSHKILVYLKL
jgi:hypothetical protein